METHYNILYGNNSIEIFDQVRQVYAKETLNLALIFYH